MAIREDILKLSAGREIDALISEKIFGIPFRKPTHGTCCTCQVCGWDIDDCQCGFSENIEKAWTIVENFIKRGWYFEISTNYRADVTFSVCVRDSTHGTWSADGGDEDGWITEDARGETAPLAICRAALLAISAT